MKERTDETMEDNGLKSALGESVERLAATATLLEKTVAWLEERHMSMTGDVARIVATVEGGESAQAGRDRYAELERKLQAAEQQIAEMKAQAASTAPASARKTLPTATTQLLAKQGISSVDSIEAGTLDAALAGLSLEQRIAVKAQLIRTGALL